jgi:NhaP-type Na+/H+ or K+/H+ antiporter
MTLDLAVVALLIAGYALLAGAMNRRSIGPALAFVVIGIVLSEDVLGPISLEPAAEAVKVLAEVTLTLLLFADASTVRLSSLRRDAVPVARLLVVGLLLTIAAGTVGAWLLFPGISLGVALVIGAALAPTDAALGQPVVTDRAVPARIRRLLNVESGLNDGIATPFVLLALTLASAEAGAEGSWLVTAVTETAVGVLAGVVLGLLGGVALRAADRLAWTTEVSRKLFVLALAAGCYLVADALGGNGFIAAFVGGLAFGAGTRQEEEDSVRFTEAQGSLLAIGVWTAFGLSLAGQVLTELWDPRAIGYAVLSLTLLRMLPVGLALIGLGLRPQTVLFMGWFGPRGLASIVFLVIALESLRESGVDATPVTVTIVWTVLLSVVLHGLTAGPLAAIYGRWAGALPAGSPELADAAEPQVARPSWVGHQGPGDPSVPPPVADA